MKTLWKTALLVLAAAAAVACVKEQTEAEVPVESVPVGYHMVTIKAGKVNDDPATKTSYDKDKVFSWNSGDAISVLFNNGATNKFFTFTTSGTGSSATFSGLVEDGYDTEGALTSGTKWALFPASANHVYTSDTAIQFYIPEADNGNVCNIPMIAQNAGSQYEFHHMAGAIKFTFRGLAANQNVKLTFDSRNTNRYTSGLFNILKLSDGVSNAIIRGNNHEDGAKMTREVTATANASGVAYIYMPLPMSEHPDSDDLNSEYWTSFYFDLWDNADNNLCELHPASGKYFNIHKGRITVMGSKQLGEEPKGGIIIDGSFNDWDAHTERYRGNCLGEFKATADRNNLYLFQRIIKDNFTNSMWSNYQFVYVDTDNDNTTGCTSSSAYKKGAEVQWKFFTYFDDPSAPYKYKSDESTPFQTWGASSWENAAFTGFTEATMYRAVMGSEYLDIEYCIPLSTLGVTPNPSSTKDIAIGLYCHFKDGSNATVYPTTSRITVTIPGPSAPKASPINLAFTELADDILNPERGLYGQKSFCFDGSTLPSLSISSSLTDPLVLTLFYLTGYKDKDLDSDVTDAIGTVFSNLRAAGKKAIVRFGYSSDHGEGDKPWDAGVTQMRKHIAQIKPILAANEDVIYVVQAGFIGTYGEWYYTGNGYGDTRDDFYYSVSGSTLNHFENRAQIITDLLDAVPSSRQLALRTPFYKRYFFAETTSSGINDWTPIADWDMDDDNKRLAFHNDAFLSNSGTDMGTIKDATDRSMWNSQSAYLVMGGETAYEDGAPDPSYSAPAVALSRISDEHMSYLNKNPENKIMKSWIDAGDLEDIKKALGYRLVLNSADFTYASTTSGSTVNYSIKIENTGSACVIYPRPFKLVLLHAGSCYQVKDLGVIRNVAPGAAATTLTGSFSLPVDLEGGDRLAIWLPDNADGLRTNSAYSIRLANEEVTWYDGYNIICTF